VAAPLSVPDRASLAGLVEQISRDSEMVLAMLQLPENDADDELFGALSGLLELALEQHEARADLHHRQALVLDRLGRQDEAIAHARRAVEINPQFVQAHILLGSLLMGRQPQAAESHLRQAVASGGDYADVHLRLADLARQAGNLEQARAELARALEINGNYEQAKAALADLAA
jgi:tetratricopeptide (TPR) repeat protein